MIWKKLNLVDQDYLLSSQLPDHLSSSESFERVWNLHPQHFNQIKMFEKEVYIPRYQQAYGKDYHFSKQVSQALPVPSELSPYLDWAQEINPNYNGLLLNWYDVELKHYIGKHRDSEIGLIKNSPIITISLGGTRAFRMRKVKSQGFYDIEVQNGSVVAIPWLINQRYTHEVPHLEKYTGNRVSITIRAFKDASKSGLDS